MLQEWTGVFAATLCPFQINEEIDEAGLTSYIESLCKEERLKGLVPNGHTGEIMALNIIERAKVTSIVKKACRIHKPKLKVISGVSSEGSRNAKEEASLQKEAGADAILLMPPHHWLRFGRKSNEAIGFFQDVAEANIDIVVHQYPAWTKASYTLEEMLELIKIPQVKCIKMGTRNMATWLYDYEKIKNANPEISIITCHDEFLLPTLLEAGDGALIGFAGFAPKLMCDLVYACMDQNLYDAKEAQKMVAPLARLIYNFGEPGCGAHQRMKVIKWLLGEISSPVFRKPIRPLPEKEINSLRVSLEALNLKVKN